MTYCIVWLTKTEAQIREDLGIPSPLPLPNPLPVGTDIFKNLIVWFEVQDDDAEQLEVPLGNWISRASSKKPNEESGQIMGNRTKYAFVVGESAFRKYMTEKLGVIDFTPLAKETWTRTVNDPLESDYNHTSTLRAYTEWEWSSLALAINQARIEGVSVVKQ